MLSAHHISSSARKKDGACPQISLLTSKSPCKERNSKREAEEAARVLLVDNANHFSQSTSIEGKLTAIWNGPENSEVCVWSAASATSDDADD
jgi:hypothetical protein